MSNSQIAVGEKIVQHHYGPGSTVNNIVSGDVRAPRARPRPLSQLPRDLPRLHGRTAEVDRARGALGRREPIQFCGPSGLGKTALLRHLSHRPGTPFTDGVVYYRSRRESLDDLLMRIFEFLYDSDGATKVKPTTAELGSHLGALEALFLLDDVDLDREDLETLLLTLPRSVFVLGSPERSLWSDGESLLLRGLTPDAALALVADGLGRAPSAAERAGFEQLCDALDGHPLQLVKAVAQVRDEGATPAQLLSEARGGAVAAPAAHRLTAQAAGQLSEAERRVLSLLAALDGAPLHIGHVAALTGEPDAAAILAGLEERGLAQSHSPRYSATAPVAALQDQDTVDRSRASLLAYFIDRAECHRDEPERMRDDLEPIIQTLRWGMTGAAHADVVRLARASGVIAESAGLWDCWRTILDVGLEAARMIGDRAGEAWALHQLGTRALCLDEEAEAARRLEEALRIREQIGDKAGAAVTRHNLDHLPGLPPPSPPGGPSGGPPWLTTLGVVGAVAILTVPAIPVLSSQSGDDAAARPARPLVAPRHPSGRAVRAPHYRPGAHRPATGDMDALPSGDRRGPLVASRDALAPSRPHGPSRRPPKDRVSRPPVVIPEHPPRDEPVPNEPSDTTPAAPPKPPPEPEPAPAPVNCGGIDLVGAVANALRRELGAARLPLKLDRVVAAQPPIVQGLVQDLVGRGCSRVDIDAALRRLGVILG